MDVREKKITSFVSKQDAMHFREVSTLFPAITEWMIYTPTEISNEGRMINPIEDWAKDIRFKVNPFRWVDEPYFTADDINSNGSRAFLDFLVKNGGIKPPHFQPKNGDATGPALPLTASKIMGSTIDGFFSTPSESIDADTFFSIKWEGGKKGFVPERFTSINNFTPMDLFSREILLLDWIYSGRNMEEPGNDLVATVYHSRGEEEIYRTMIEYPIFPFVGLVYSRPEKFRLRRWEKTDKHVIDTFERLNSKWWRNRTKNDRSWVDKNNKLEKRLKKLEKKKWNAETEEEREKTDRKIRLTKDKYSNEMERLTKENERYIELNFQAEQTISKMLRHPKRYIDHAKWFSIPNDEIVQDSFIKHFESILLSNPDFLTLHDDMKSIIKESDERMESIREFIEAKKEMDKISTKLDKDNLKPADMKKLNRKKKELDRLMMIDYPEYVDIKAVMMRNNLKLTKYSIG